jgi:hypothetical protein
MSDQDKRAGDQDEDDNVVKIGNEPAPPETKRRRAHGVGYGADIHLRPRTRLDQWFRAARKAPSRLGLRR